MKKHRFISHSNYDLQSATSLIYDLAWEQDTWPKVLSHMSEYLNADQAVFRIFDLNVESIPIVFRHNKSAEWDKIYFESIKDTDPFKQIFWKHENLLGRTDQLLTHNQLIRTEVYNEYMKPQGYYFGIGGTFNIGQTNKTYFGFHRPKNADAFSHNDIKFLEQLLPHFQNSLKIGMKTRSLEIQNALLVEALGKATYPMLLVDKYMRVLFINETAERLIDSADEIEISKGRITTRCKITETKLSKYTFEACKAVNFRKGSNLDFWIGPNRKKISVQVQPINPDLVSPGYIDRNCALMVLSEPGAKKIDRIANLKTVYGFTNTEARLAGELCNGLSIEEYLVKYGITRNTIKTQLRACYQKSGTKDLASLIRLILG